jgi:hypothetical protein
MTPDHGKTVVEKVFEVIGQIGQVFAVSLHPARIDEKYQIG